MHVSLLNASWCNLVSNSLCFIQPQFLFSNPLKVRFSFTNSGANVSVYSQQSIHIWLQIAYTHNTHTHEILQQVWKMFLKKKKELKGHRTFNRLHQKEIFCKKLQQKMENGFVLLYMLYVRSFLGSHLFFVLEIVT